MHGFLLHLVLLLAAGQVDPPFDVEAVDVVGAPHRLDAADPDGDGEQDLAITCAKAGHIALLVNRRL